MKRLAVLALTLMLLACNDGDVFGSCGETTEWRCDSNRVQSCNHLDEWETFQDCSSTNETCRPAFVCNNGFGLPCCEGGGAIDVIEP